MRHASRSIGRAMFGAAVLTSLGLGATQAFGAPGGGGTAGRNHCDYARCDSYCIAAGYSGGTCTGVGGHGCLCY